MEENAYLGEVIAGLVFFIAGVRLLRLAVQTGRAPERFLSASFLLWGLGYALYDLPYALTDDDAVRMRFFLASRVAIDAGTIAFALFTQRVFRSREHWATWLVAGTAVCLIAGVAGSLWVGDWEGIRPLSNPWYWPERLAGTAPLAWMAIEGFLHYAKARSRRRLGLCDPLVCNRFLLWGVSGVLWVMLELVIFPQEIGYEATREFSAVLGVLSGSLEVIPVALLWITFFPPACYRSWVAGSGAAVVAAEEDPAYGG
jgi:hypothetical protein